MLLSHLDKLPEAQKRQILEDLERRDKIFEKERAQNTFMGFVNRVWPDFIGGRHHSIMAKAFERVANGECKRLIINMPPRHTKSEFASYMLPAWFLGKYPNKKIIQCSNTAELAVGFGRKVRNLVNSADYQAVFPTKLSSDSKAAGRWNTDRGGDYFAIGVGGAVTGKGADVLIIDDPHSVEGASSDQQRQSTLEWFTEAVPTRLNNPKKSAIVVVMQRLHEEDVSGIILDRKMGYDHLCLPMRATLWRKDFPTKLGFVDPRMEEGELLFPARFPPEVVDRDEKTMGPYATAGQHQQEPAPRGGGIIQREWWKPWEEANYPPMDFVVAALDTAYTEKAENDPSALTVWGVFSGSQALTAHNFIRPNGQMTSFGQQQGMFDEALQVRAKTYLNMNSAPRVVLMYAWQERLELHNLVNKVASTCRRMKVDKLLVENKASGHSVAQELKRVFGHEDFMVQIADIRGGSRGLDKVARLHSVAHLFAEGMIYAPDKQWAEMVIQQAAVFPRGKHDDLVDTVSMALRHLRDAGMLVRAPEWAADAQDALSRSGTKAPPPIYPA